MRPSTLLLSRTGGWCGRIPFVGYAGFWFGICFVLLAWSMFGNPLDYLREQLAHSASLCLFKYAVRSRISTNLASKSCSALFSYNTLLYLESGRKGSQIGRHSWST